MRAKLQEAMKAAMKAKDKVRMDTIRGLLSAMQYEEIEKKVDSLPEEDCLLIFQREIKKRKEELDFAEKAGRQDLLDKLKIEISVTEEFLPRQLSAEELQKTIEEMKASKPGINLGVVMKSLKEKYAGQYDSKLASELGRKILGA